MDDNIRVPSSNVLPFAADERRKAPRQGGKVAADSCDHGPIARGKPAHHASLCRDQEQQAAPEADRHAGRCAARADAGLRTRGEIAKMHPFMSAISTIFVPRRARRTRPMPCPILFSGPWRVRAAAARRSASRTSSARRSSSLAFRPGDFHPKRCDLQAPGRLAVSGLRGAWAAGG